MTTVQIITLAITCIAVAGAVIAYRSRRATERKFPKGH